MEDGLDECDEATKRKWPERAATRPGQTRCSTAVSAPMLPRLPLARLRRHRRPARGPDTRSHRMRNIPIPVDTARLTFVCVTDPRPRLVSQNTGEVKTDRNGRTVYQVGLSAADGSGRVELVNVNVSGEPQVRVGQVVHPAALVGFAWEQTRGGELRWGIAYRAEAITPVAAPVRAA